MRSFSDQPIIRKTNILTLSIVASFIFVIILLFGTYWALGSSREIKRTTAAEARNNASSIDGMLENLTDTMVRTYGTLNFASEMISLTGSDLNHTQKRVALQNELISISTSDSRISSVLMIDKQGMIYALFQDFVIPTVEIISYEEILSLRGMTMLSERLSPVHINEPVIPVVYPINTQYGGTIITDGNYEFIVIVLYSAERIYEMLAPDSAILNRDGTVLASNSHLPISSDIKEGESQKGRIYSYTVRLPFSGLYIRHSADLNRGMLDLFTTAFALILAAITLLIAFITFYSLMLRRYVTTPIRKLSIAVKEIEEGNYDAKADFSSKDELGELNTTLSMMAKTIEMQIEAIREEKELQTKTEMRLLTEQLTPHFLYNTLECIQQEIQRGRSESAAEMTRALSTYLRTVLSYGSESIKIKEEIQHEMSYIRIMNGRFRKDIAYHYECSPELENESILKMILQPFIENSVKHGFGIGDGAMWVVQPEITVTFKKDGDRIRIEIKDNGKGFDKESLQDIFYNEEKAEGHVGLRTTYLRLIKFYGEENVFISLSSIPYFESVISITIPLKLPK